MPEEVNAWAEKIKFPTYRIGTPETHPLFLEKRVYQGSSGAVYPYPVIDRIFDEKSDQEYTALFLENRYLKLMVLPELGGRIHMAFAKTNQRHFIYFNRVIKPALVGLTGPWISGGIEFNWPQHHRPTTFSPLDWKIQGHADGSKTIWCAEIEAMFRTKGMHGITLYPERAYFEVRVQLYNRTSETQTFLWWANPAVSTHDDHQSVFPPDVHAVMDHGKRAVTDFPIATGVYYKVNYAPGTDIRRYKNIPVPTSYMVYHSDFDFMGDYDHRAGAGMLHVANHHIVPGKKQWTWGHGDFGQAWDRQLTDEDGPYIELMCGAYTDNQPDFSWIHPGEEKSFSQFFFPYQKIGPPCNANQHAALRLEISEGNADFGVYTTSARQINVQLTCQGQTVYEQSHFLDPETPLLNRIPIPPGAQLHELKLAIIEGDQVLLDYAPRPDENPPVPPPAAPAPRPQEVESIEGLLLNGLHLEQYRHATFLPDPYYLEALRRDPGDSRCNNAIGKLYYRRGKFSLAEDHFRVAIQRLTLRNPNPYDGEPYYNLGLALKMQGKFEAAFTAFHKAVWNAAWQDAAYFELARLTSRRRDYPLAFDYLERSLDRNSRHHKARHLKIALLRNAGKTESALDEAAISLEADPIEYGALWEHYLLTGDQTFDEIVADDPVTLTELALDYTHAGLYNDAIILLERLPTDPLAVYTLGWVLLQSEQEAAARSAFMRGAALDPGACFPNRIEDVLIFEAAQQMHPSDARAPYLLGNFWYAHHRYDEAIACWEKAAQLDRGFAVVYRNLGLAYFNHRGDVHQAQVCFERAFEFNPNDARLFFELDQLYKRLNTPPSTRLTLFERHLDLVEQRDDLSIEYVTLLNLHRRYGEAHQYLMARKFHPWEGGEGKVIGQYVASLVESARMLLEEGHTHPAIEKLTQAQAYPSSLGEGKLFGALENHVFYYLGCCYEAQGRMEKARAAFERAASGAGDPTSPLYYYDLPPEMIYYQGLALSKLDQNVEANTAFMKMITYGHTHLNDLVELDYFAVSLPDFLVFEADLNARNRFHCHYMLGLGYLGLGDRKAAREHLDTALQLDANHLGAVLHRYSIEK